MGEAPGRRQPPAPGEPVRPDGGFGGELAGQALPFLHRYMLNYGQEAKFELVVKSKSTSGPRFRVAGGTRSALINIRHQASSAGSTVTTRHGIDDFPVFLTVSDVSGSQIQGNTYVSIHLEINENPVVSLISGFLSADKGLSWPGPPLAEKIPNHGEISSLASANPAAGAQVSLTVDDDEIWRVLWMSIRLVTDATSATRQLHITLDNGGTGIVNVFSSIGQTASQARNYTFGIFGTFTTKLENEDILVAIPDELWLEGDTAITTTLDNGVAGDDLGALSIMREKFYV